MASTPTQNTDPARVHDNRALVLELLARFSAGDLDGARDLIHEEFLSHNPRVPHDPAASSGGTPSPRTSKARRGSACSLPPSTYAG